MYLSTKPLYIAQPGASDSGQLLARSFPCKYKSIYTKLCIYANASGVLMIDHTNNGTKCML